MDVSETVLKKTAFNGGDLDARGAVAGAAGSDTMTMQVGSQLLNTLGAADSIGATLKANAAQDISESEILRANTIR